MLIDWVTVAAFGSLHALHRHTDTDSMPPVPQRSAGPQGTEAVAWPRSLTVQTNICSPEYTFTVHSIGWVYLLHVGGQY